MKTYKILLAPALLAVFAACTKIQPQEQTLPVPDEEEMCLVSFRPTGEITTTDTPLLRGSEPTDDLYLVQAYQGTESFAFGYFDNLNAMKLYLKKGYKYRIIVAMVKNAKALLGDRFDANMGLIDCSCKIGYTYHSDVFDLYMSNPSYTDGTMVLASRFDAGRYVFPINQYTYTYKKQIPYYYKSGEAWKLASSPLKQYNMKHCLKNIGTGVLNATDYPTCEDWFYGEVNDYSPTGDYATLDIGFRRAGFRLKYELSGVTDGQVTVTIGNSARTFLSNTTDTPTFSSDEMFIAFHDTQSAWQYAANGYTENLQVSVSWLRGIGVTQDLGTKTIQVKRNCLNTIKILLGSDDRGAGVGIQTEAEGTATATLEIPVN
ncbi:MAG: hypothetical protein J6O01_02305 [Bacteroidales bacterium]|nr:hypothetical protein [Bacteroidales bacterium]